MSDLKLQALITVANKASGPLREINSDLNKLRSPIRGLVRQVKGLDRASGFKEMRKGVSGLVAEMSKVGLFGAAAAAAGFAAINKMAETGDEIIKTATAVGMSTDALQEYRFVAEQSGVSTAVMNKSMQAFTKRLAEARNGTGELYGLLEKRSPALLDQLLAIKDNSEAFDLMVKSMAKLPDQQRQILLGDKAFSESGRELVKIAALGADGINRLKKEAHDYGFVLSKETLLKSAEFRDTLNKLTSVVRNIAFALGSEFIPEITNLMKNLQQWYLLNKDIIKVKVAEFARKVAAGIKDFQGWVKSILPHVKQFIDNIGGLKTVAIGLGLVLAGPLLSAVVTLGAALLATPLGLIITGVASLAIGAKALYDNFEPLRDLISTIVGSFNEFVNLIKFINQNGIGAYVSGLAKSVFGENGRPPGVPAVNQGQASLFQRGSSSFDRKPGFLKGLQANGQSKQNTDIGGVLKIDIHQTGIPRVRELKSNNPALRLDVDTGLGMAAL